MSQIVDARGLSCPQPVLLTKKAVDKGEFPIEVLVETDLTGERTAHGGELGMQGAGGRFGRRV